MLLVVQEQHAGQGVDHGRTGPGLLAAFQAGVVVDGHAGQGGQFLAPQPGRAPRPGAGGQAHVGGPHAGAPGPQEPAQLGLLGGHDSSFPRPHRGQRQ